MLKDEKYDVKALNGLEELVRVGTKTVPTLRNYSLAKLSGSR